jgi:hypothetical protein
MKKLLLSLIAVAILTGVALAQYQYFTPVYWVGGRVTGAPAGEPVYFFKTLADVTADPPQYTRGYIDDSGNFLLNGFAFQKTFLKVGEKHYLATEQKEGKGAGPTEVMITGSGYDRVADMAVVPGGGFVLGKVEVVNEPPPTLRLTFGKRLYQPNIYWIPEKGDKPFVVSPDTELKVEASIDLPFTLAKDIESYQIVVDEGTSMARTVTLNAANVEKKTYASGTGADEGFITSMSLKYKFDEPLTEGKHGINVIVRSSGLRGTAAVSTQFATVEVMGGPLRVIGVPITFPSPYSIIKDGTVSIQYELSANGSITVYLNSPTGEILKKWNFEAGTEGGSAGVNKITWDGRSDQGYQAGNAIYLGSILSRDENRMLAKYKLTIVN